MPNDQQPTLTPATLREAVARAIDDEPELASDIERDITAAPVDLAARAIRAIVEAAGLDARIAANTACTLEIGARTRDQVGVMDVAGEYRRVAGLLRALAEAAEREGGR